MPLFESSVLSIAVITRIYFCARASALMMAASAYRASDERSLMHSQTIRYARNGALGAIALYLAVALPLLAVSMQHPAQRGPTASDAAPAAPSRGSFT